MQLSLLTHHERLTNGKCLRRAHAAWPEVMAAAEASQQTAMVQEALQSRVLDQPAPQPFNPVKPLPITS